MSMGIQYVRLSASEISTLDSTIFSGKVPTGDHYVVWDSANGFTGHGWDVGWLDGGPFTGYTQQQIDEILDNLTSDGNLNSVFNDWSTHVPDVATRLLWMLTHCSGCLENA